MARKLRQFRIRFEYDPDGASTLHDPAGKPLPGSRKVYEENPITPGGGAALTYEQYCEYYGNPDRHVVLGAILEEACPHCGTWGDARDEHHKAAMTSLWGIDVMDDDREAGEAGMVYASDAFHKIPGYLREVTRDLLSETGISQRRINQLAPAWKLGQR